MTKPVIVFNDDPKYFLVSYYDNDDVNRKKALESAWNTFKRYDPALGRHHQIWTRLTNPNLEVVVDHYFPSNSTPGKYRVETFIPAVHSNTRRAIFTVTHGVSQTYEQISEDTTMVVVDMSELHDVWHTLGEYYLDPKQNPVIGKVRQYDISLEDPPKEASYGPVRWVPLFVSPDKKNRFDAPVGTKDERNAVFPNGRGSYGRYPIWVGSWFDANPFLNWYTYGFHTGADLNLPGVSSADKGKEIYTIGDGVVTFAGSAGSWGNIIVIEHQNALVTLPNGTQRKQNIYSRYGHVDDRINVRKGQFVKRGQNIGYIGLAANQVSGWHLHFDICYTDLLKTRPAHWPNLDAIRALRWSGRDREYRTFSGTQSGVFREVINNYVDPLRFISDNHN